MTVGHINIKTTIERIQKELKDGKNISPVLSSSIELLILVIQMLIDRQSMNSSNSSFPPATDQGRRSRGKYKKKRKKKVKKSIGAQPGHDGTTLTQYEDPDEIIELSIDRRTLPQGHKFIICEPETRQVVDLNLEFIIREYQAEVLEDEDGKRHVALFPSHITKAIQYGPSVKSFAVYMSQYQLLPYARIQEVFKDQFDLKISQGSLCNFNKEAFDKFEDYESSIIKQLKSKDVLNADETGIKVDAELAWVHVLCTPTLTLMVPHKKRGKEAMKDMGIIPNYKGVLVHDHWKPYLGYDCEHALCNAHHLRELQWVIDFKEHKWAKSMKRFLLNLNKLVDEHGGILPDDIQKKKKKRFKEIIKLGNTECLVYHPVKSSGKKKAKQTKERNLLDRLDEFEDQVLLFMKNKTVPFTNNQAERDIRMLKVHQKVSGQFKTLQTAKHFCRIRSCLMTAKKRGISPYDKLNLVFTPKDAE